jgi:hypothetical protein
VLCTEWNDVEDAAASGRLSIRLPAEMNTTTKLYFALKRMSDYYIIVQWGADPYTPAGFLVYMVVYF